MLVCNEYLLTPYKLIKVFAMRHYNILHLSTSLNKTAHLEHTSLKRHFLKITKQKSLKYKKS
jgi:hypothetical protein